MVCELMLFVMNHKYLIFEAFHSECTLCKYLQNVAFCNVLHETKKARVHSMDCKKL